MGRKGSGAHETAVDPGGWEDKVIWSCEKLPVAYIGVCTGVRGKRRTVISEMDGNGLSLSRAGACGYSRVGRLRHISVPLLKGQQN